MTPERWAIVERLYHAALERDASERDRFIAEACAGNDALRREVLSLLDHDGGAAFLSTPAAAEAGHLMQSGGVSIGQTIGQYVISVRLGAGGMGEVYRARDLKLGRDVAIKVLPAFFTSDQDRLARFAREARILASLNHPHIGAIYGVEDAGVVRALVLELVDGPTLADRIAAGPIPLAEALLIAQQIADALEAAHEKGVIHRDLKPANIKITADGVVKVLDFGLAKAADGPANLDTGADMSQTREGVVLGTAAYMSPEQASGYAVDKRTDIWAFGCVFYEMLTGRAAFSGSSIAAILAAILERTPDWTALPNATPAGVHRLLHRCLEKDSKRRLHDIADGRIEIADALQAKQSGPPHARSRVPALVGAAAVVLGVALGGWVVTRPRQPAADAPVLRLQINPPEGGRFGQLATFSPALALSPDGRTVVFDAIVDGKKALWLRSLDDTKARLLPGTQNARWPFWSPDGKSIAFFSGGKLQRLDVAGGEPLTISDAPVTFGGSWAPDGRIVVGIFGGALASVPDSGGTLLPLTTLDPSMSDVAHVWPQVLPGGRFLYWAGSSQPKLNCVVYAASFDKPNERTSLVTTETRALFASGPDGREYLLWQRSGTLVAQEFDSATLELRGEPRPIAEGVGLVSAAGLMAVAVSTNGTLLYAPANPQRLTWFDRAGRLLGTVGDPGVYFPRLRISPDGRQIAATRVDAARELWLIDADRGTSRRTTHDSRGGFDPQWSPDGRTILFAGETLTALYRKDATGAAPDERIAPLAASNLTDWSRDGRFLLNTRTGAETQSDIWIVPVTPDGRLAVDAQPRPYLRTPVNEAEGRFSPEQNPRWVAYQSNESGRSEVYVQSFPEPRGPHRMSTDGGSDPQWGPDGRELFYRSTTGKVMVVSVTLGVDTVKASAPLELFSIPTDTFFEAAPDGRRFLVSVPDPAPRPLTVVVNWPSLMRARAGGQ